VEPAVDVDRELLYKVCRMYYLDNLTQQRIGDRLGVSRMKVARLLSQARDLQLVETRLTFQLPENTRIEWEIEQKYGVNQCVAVPAYRDHGRVVRALGAAVSRILQRSLSGGMILGVSWGKTLEGVSRHLSLERSFEVKVMPVVGGMGIEGSGSYTNYVTRSFAERIGGTNYTITVPAVVDTRETRDLLESDGSTRKIACLAGKADMLLVGMSDAAGDSSLGRTGYFDEKELGALRELGVVGNVNLVFINRDGAHVPNPLEDRIIRILPPERMKAVPMRIGAAFGERKTQVIASALKGKWINTLITDEETARSILEENK
jgi:DNA-binding transcriptional regulator LsrR (DeoR family)